MTSKIRVLSDHTINKIAAGEVIENPASVVKELVENSLDALAAEITVEIKSGGRQLIRITDNGCGMNSDDALLCLERHATSKLKDIEDIYALDTMGFRGEAIPSIASISKFTLLTRLNDKANAGQLGTMVIVEGGKILQCASVECALGTSIEVKQLFFNIAVRKKFQRSPSYDTTEILRVVLLQALANPQVKFTLISNQETLLTTPLPPTTNFEELLGERIKSLLGDEFFRQQCYLEGSCEDCSLQGFIGVPSYTKHNRTEQFILVNRRPIVSPLISCALREGYGSALQSGRYPACVLHLTLPADLLDVNVHPQKREVRLRQEHQLKALISGAVEKTLQKQAFTFPSSFVEAYASVRHDLSFAVKPNFMAAPSPAFSGELPAYNFPFDDKEPFEPYVKPVVSIPAPSEVKAAPSKTLPQQSELFEALPKVTNSYKVIATLQRYILAQPVSISGNSAVVLCLIDQRAAHGRIIYEKLMAQQTGHLELQTLLIPYTFDFTASEAAMLREHLAVLQSMGIQIKEFGANTFMVDALPAVFGNVDMHKFISEVVNDLHAFGSSDSMRRENEKKIAAIASRTAVSGEKRLTVEEAQALVDHLTSCQQPNQCPHGKAVITSLSLQDIGNLFMRSNKNELP